MCAVVCLLITLLCRCPVDSYVFPELDRGRNGDTLEAHFNAFKIPESNFLVFEATVRTCREGCQPAYCPSSSGRSEPSFGRRRREINETAMENGGNIIEEDKTNTTDTALSTKEDVESDDKENEIPEYVREMIEVRSSVEHFEIPSTLFYIYN